MRDPTGSLATARVANQYVPVVWFFDITEKLENEEFSVVLKYGTSDQLRRHSMDEKLFRVPFETIRSIAIMVDPHNPFELVNFIGAVGKKSQSIKDGINEKLRQVPLYSDKSKRGNFDNAIAFFESTEIQDKVLQMAKLQALIVSMNKARSLAEWRTRFMNIS